MLANVLHSELVFGLLSKRVIRYEGFPEGLIKPDFSIHEFGRVHLHAPTGEVTTYLVTFEESDSETVIRPVEVLQDLAYSLEILVDKVVEWGEDRNIIGAQARATLLTQLAKTQEELDETVAAANCYNKAKSEGVTELEAFHDEVVDGIGDQVVTLILAAELAGVSLSYCLRHAYNQIKNRTGKIVDGQFVKDK